MTGETHINSEQTLVINENSVSKIMERFKFNEYLVNPLARTWSSSIRTLTIVYLFAARCMDKIIGKHMRNGEKDKQLRWQAVKNNILKEDMLETKQTLNETFTCLINKDCPNGENENRHNTIKSTEQNTASENNAETTTDRPQKKLHMLELFKSGIELNFYKNVAITYYLILASLELENFVPKSTLKKHTYKRGSIYFSRTRYLKTSHLYSTLGEETNLLDYNIQDSSPVLDRYNPTAISISFHFHNVIAQHRGVDQSYLKLMSSVFILQGQPLMTEIVKSCIRCRIKLKKRYYKQEGPLSQIQLTFGGIHRYVCLDMSGPYTTLSGLRARTTRTRTGTTKSWLLHGVCIMSNYSTITVLEDYSTESFVQAIHRMGCWLGYPEVAYLDNSWTEIKGLKNSKFTMLKAIHKAYDEMGITIKLCASGGEGHARLGRIERRVGLCKRFFEMKRQDISYLTPLGLETLAKQAASFLNSLPLATRKRTGATVASELITPNMFLVGRDGGYRAPGGCPTLNENRGEILSALQRAQEGMLKYFVENIPDLILRTTWTKPSNELENLKIGDTVLFQKDASAHAIEWKLGVIHGIEQDDDQEGRILEIGYINASETKLPLTRTDNTVPKIRKRYTRKSCHTICKIMAIDEPDMNKDLVQLNRMLEEERVGEARSEKSTNKRSTNKSPTPLTTECSQIYWKMNLNHLLEEAVEK